MVKKEKNMFYLVAYCNSFLPTERLGEHVPLCSLSLVERVLDAICMSLYLSTQCVPVFVVADRKSTSTSSLSVYSET